MKKFFVLVEAQSGWVDRRDVEIAAERAAASGCTVYVAEAQTLYKPLPATKYVREDLE